MQKKNLRPKKLHLNTFFLWLKMFFLIENVFFDWSNLFCVWAILWVGHLCLYYSIKKKKLNQKTKSLQIIFFKVRFYFCIRTLFFFDLIIIFLIEHFFFLIEFFFFVWSAKSFEVFFFLIESFWHKYPAVGGCFPIGRTCLSDKTVYTNDVWVAISFYNKQVAICNVPAADGDGKTQDGTSVVVESLCLESESRLESPVSESESNPSHKKKIRVESTTHTSQVRVESLLIHIESESALKHTCCYTLKNITVVPFTTVLWIAYYAIHKTWLWATAGLRSTSLADQRGVQLDPIRSASRIRSESRDTLVTLLT